MLSDRVTSVTEFDIITRLLVATLLGGLVGLEREFKGHAAGLRTSMMVCLGSAIFMLVSEEVTHRYLTWQNPPDPTRIASTIVTGIGFLGAGMIFQGQNRIRNLTTAAGIWVVAAIGMAAGGGFFISAVTGTIISLVILALLTPFERWLRNRFVITNADQRPRSREDED